MNIKLIGILLLVCASAFGPSAVQQQDEFVDVGAKRVEQDQFFKIVRFAVANQMYREDLELSDSQLESLQELHAELKSEDSRLSQELDEKLKAKPRGDIQAIFRDHEVAEIESRSRIMEEQRGVLVPRQLERLSQLQRRQRMIDRDYLDSMFGVLKQLRIKVDGEHKSKMLEVKEKYQSALSTLQRETEAEFLSALSEADRNKLEDYLGKYVSPVQ